MKNIILTIDYELFLGDVTGSVQECMIEPTNKLDEILEINDSRMTIFWDILHFYRLMELENQYPDLKKDRIAIEAQICELAKKGHDVQLHLHSHWLDAKYEKGKWVFNYQHFKLHSLSKEKKADDINTILGCVTITKNLMESIIHKVDKDYKVFAFRAGGYLIEPFDEIRDAFLENNIFVDSSVCPKLKNGNGIFSYNFSTISNKNKYRFNDCINENINDGRFIEVPIATQKIPKYRKIYNSIMLRLRYRTLEQGRKGTGSGGSSKKKRSIFSKIVEFVFTDQFMALTTDSSFEEKYNYVLNNVPDYSTQILHPKLLNKHTLNILKHKLTKMKVRFITLKDFLND